MKNRRTLFSAILGLLALVVATLYLAPMLASEAGRAAELPAREAPGSSGETRHATAFSPTNFASNEMLRSHFEKHASEWGSGELTEREYLEKARALLSAELGGDIEGFVRANGDVLRYDTRANEFVSAAADGTIRTFFRPDRGLDYWLGQTRP